MILKVILFALCANLLYTNANLMIEVSENLTKGTAALMVVFALTYSLISTLSLFKLRSAFTAVCFAILDGFAVYSHLSVHGGNFKTVVGVYFGVYTAYTLIVAYIIKRQDEDGGNGAKTTVEGHDAQYWYKCFVFQRDRADGKAANGDKMKPVENTEPQPTIQPTAQPQIPTHKPQPIAQTADPELPMMQTVAPTVAAPKKPFQIAGMSDDEARELLSVKRAFARVQDTDKRRERAAQIQSEAVRAEIVRLYGL